MTLFDRLRAWLISAVMTDPTTYYIRRYGIVPDRWYQTTTTDESSAKAAFMAGLLVAATPHKSLHGDVYPIVDTTLEATLDRLWEEQKVKMRKAAR